MIRLCRRDEESTIWEIVNDGAKSYKGIVPADRLADPYMTEEELHDELADGVEFWGFEKDERLLGVMGIQPVKDVTLIRHAYVRSTEQQQGVGAGLLGHLRGLTESPILIGTWADATWAIRFYEKHGFEQVPKLEKNELLTKYWHVPERQIETSVVLADAAWRNLKLQTQAHKTV